MADSFVADTKQDSFVPDQQSAAARFGSGLWNTTVGGLLNTGKAALDLVGQGIAHPGYIDPTSPGGKAIQGIIESHLDQARKAKEAWDKGEHVEALGHLGAAALPVIGPAAAHAGERIGEGDIAGGLGEGAGLIAGVAAPGAITKVTPGAIRAAAPAAPVARDALAGAWEGAKAPVSYGRFKLPVPAPIAGAVGGGIAARELGLPHEIGAVVGAAYPLVRGARAGIAAGRAARAAEAASEAAAATAPEAAAAADTAILDGIARDLAGKPFDKLDANGQAMVRQIAGKLGQATQPPETAPQPVPAAAAAPEAAPPAAAQPPPAYEGTTAPGTTVQDLIQQELATRRAQAAAAAPVLAPETETAPIAAAHNPEDLARALRDLIARRRAPAAPEAPAEASPEVGPPETPAEPATATPAAAGAAPQAVEELSTRINEGLPSEPAAKPPYVPPERGNIANKLGDLLAENGYTTAKLDELETNPAARGQFYKTLGGAHRKGYVPSEDTIDLIRERVAARTAAQAPAPVIVMPAPARPMTALERMAAKTDTEALARKKAAATQP
jgi:hypothetical protein